MNDAVLRKLYNAFNPAEPLQAGDAAYVDCREARGDRDILQDIGRDILWSNAPCCQLYAGHRGAGKSTELLRLKKHLEDNGKTVVYFAADEEDIDPEDARYTDILLSCTRHLLETLRDRSDPGPLLRWLHSRWQSLKTLATTEIEFENLNLEGQICQFAKLSANLRAVPSTRQKIREQVDAHTVSLLDALNEFITGIHNGPATDLVVIADNLDRIVPVRDGESRRTNHDEIFLDRSEQLSALECHVIYTVPISMVYSSRGTHLEDRYGQVDVLPMITVRRRESAEPDPTGLATLRDLVLRRARFDDSGLGPEQLFDGDSTFDELCLMSGGHTRNLVLLVRTALQHSTDLPISLKAVRRATGELRDTYRKTVSEPEWKMLAQVHRTKEMPNQDDYRQLLFNRCVLEYRQLSDDQSVLTWQDVHPLIRGIEQFQRALQDGE